MRKKKTLGLPRHKLPPRGEAGRVPDWVKQSENECLISVAEDAYTARGLALDTWNAADVPSCYEKLVAGEKSLEIFNNPKAKVGARASAGARAARKFWEAKVCAREKRKK